MPSRLTLKGVTLSENSEAYSHSYATSTGSRSKVGDGGFQGNPVKVKGG